MIFVYKKTSFLDIDCEFAIEECGEVFGKKEKRRRLPFEFDKLIFWLDKEKVKQVLSDKLVLSDFLEFLA